LIFLTGIVVYFALQIDKGDYRGFPQKGDNQSKVNLQQRAGTIIIYERESELL
jgi:hypothetical protein